MDFNTTTVIVATLFTPAFAVWSQAPFPHQSEPQANRVMAGLPLHFEPAPPSQNGAPRFRALGAGYGFYPHSTGVTVLLAEPASWPLTAGANSSNGFSAIRHLELELLEANRGIKLQGEAPLLTRVNYFRGAVPSEWHTNLETFERVRYASVYAGIDAVFYGSQGELEFDFEIGPNANPNLIGIGFDGADRVALSRSGDLVIQAGSTELVQHRPRAYQMVNGTRIDVECNYVVGKSRTPRVGFRLSQYDASLPLVIDPVLSFAKSYGGQGANLALSIASDTNGNTYLAGWTTSPDFPLLNAFQTNYLSTSFVPASAFVMKLGTNGSLIYSTYLGGTAADRATAIAVDSAGNAYITGWTQSKDFPVSNPLQGSLAGLQNAFVAKLDSTGSKLLFSTFLGGSGQDSATGLALDAAGNIYVAGFTSSSDFPMRNPIQKTKNSFFNAFVSKLNPNAAGLAYSTYLGGSGFDYAHAIAVDAAGNAYVAGETSSPDFPVANAFQPKPGAGFPDAFVAKLNPTGNALVYSTYLGGEGTDIAYGIAVDAKGAPYVTGRTESSSYPTKNSFQPSRGGFANAFVTKLTTNGTALDYSTYLGGFGTDYGSAIAVDATGNAYIVGTGDSPNFPVVNPLQPGGGGMFTSTNSGLNWIVSNTGLIGPTVNTIRLGGGAAFAATYGGIFKSVDGGQHWRALNQGLPNTYCLALELDPANPLNLYVSNQGSVFKSANGGTNWSALNTGLPASFINVLALDPKNPGTIYAGSDNDGVYKTTNGGTIWTPMNTGLAGSSIKALLVDPNTPGVLYAAAGGFTSPGVYKSVNGGAAWSSVSVGLPGQAVNALIFKPGSTTLLAGVSDPGFGSGYGGVFQSQDGGVSWVQLLQTRFNILSLAADPANQGVLYAGAAAFTGIGLVKSTDGGATWNQAGLYNDAIISLAVDPTLPGRLYAGVDGGSDIFLAVLNPAGNSLLFSTFQGGTGTDFGQGIALDPSGGISFGGYGHSRDLQLSGAVALQGAHEQSPGTKKMATSDKPRVVITKMPGGIVAVKPCPEGKWAQSFGFDKTGTNYDSVVGESTGVNMLVAAANAADQASFDDATYSLASSSTNKALPDGIEILSSSTLLELDGIPTEPGVFTFTIKATLKNGCEYFRTVTLRVHPPAPRVSPLPGGKLKISWPTPTGANVVLERTPDLENPTWQPVSGATPDGSGIRIGVTVDASTGQAYFRLRTQ